MLGAPAAHASGSSWRPRASTSMRAEGDEIVVRLDRGGRRHARAARRRVVNCTGPALDLRAAREPLLDSLLRGRRGAPRAARASDSTTTHAAPAATPTARLAVSSTGSARCARAGCGRRRRSPRSGPGVRARRPDHGRPRARPRATRRRPRARPASCRRRSPVSTGRPARFQVPTPPLPTWITSLEALALEDRGGEARCACRRCRPRRSGGRRAARRGARPSSP